MTDQEAEKPLTFTLKGSELAAARAFQRGHDCPKADHPFLWLEDNHGYWSFDFHALGMGTAVSVKCRLCGQARDVTDVSDW